MPDIFVENKRRVMAQNIDAYFENIATRGAAIRQPVQGLSAMRAELTSDADFSEADVVAFDARSVEAARALLLLVKSTLEETATLAGKVTIQFDGVEVS